jgi:hypothetical protein
MAVVFSAHLIGKVSESEQVGSSPLVRLHVCDDTSKHQGSKHDRAAPKRAGSGKNSTARSDLERSVLLPNLSDDVVEVQIHERHLPSSQPIT